MVMSTDDRNQLYLDVSEGRIPKRIPDKLSAFCNAALELEGYFGKDLIEAQYDTEKIQLAAEKLTAKYDTDNVMGTDVIKASQPVADLYSENTVYMMGSNGYVQHPDHVGLEFEDLDELIADPIKCIWDKIIPRLYPGYNKESGESLINLYKYLKAESYYSKELSGIKSDLAKRYSRVTARIRGASARAPFDFYADRIRSFSTSMVDIRRKPEKVLEAVDVLTELVIKMGTSKPPLNRFGKATFMLHMAPFMKPKDFQKFYWPSFYKAVWEIYNAGRGIYLFVENDWTPYFDYLQELPPLTEMNVERGDPKVVKEKLGDKFVITGMYPYNTLKTGTTEQIVDQAKALIDILAPGGKYFFNTDVHIMNSQINWEGFGALVETVHEYGRY